MMYKINGVYLNLNYILEMEVMYYEGRVIHAIKFLDKKEYISVTKEEYYEILTLMQSKHY